MYHYMLITVNYLGASPRGIRRKQTFNFEASLRVLYPLAVPIKIIEFDFWSVLKLFLDWKDIPNFL